MPTDTTPDWAKTTAADSAPDWAKPEASSAPDWAKSDSPQPAINVAPSVTEQIQQATGTTDPRNESFAQYSARNPDETAQLIQKLAPTIKTPEQQEQFGRLVADKLAGDNPVDSTASQIWGSLWQTKPIAEYVKTQQDIRASIHETDKELRAKAIAAGLDPDKFAPEQGKISQLVEGAFNATENLASTVLSPGGALTMGAEALPKWMQRAVSTGFGIQMLAGTPEMAKDLLAELAKPADQRDYRKIGELTVGGLSQAALGTLSLTHALAPQTTAALKETPNLPTGRDLTMPEGARPSEGPLQPVGPQVAAPAVAEAVAPADATKQAISVPLQESQVEAMPVDQLAKLKHGDGIAFGLTQTAADVPRLQAKYDAATQAMVKAASEGDQPTMTAEFGKANYYGGALMGATRGEHPISGSNYERYIQENPSSQPQSVSKEESAAASGEPLTTPVSGEPLPAAGESKPEGVPAFISKAMEQQLADLGYSKVERNTMSPKDAYEIVKAGVSKNKEAGVTQPPTPIAESPTPGSIEQTPAKTPANAENAPNAEKTQPKGRKSFYVRPRSDGITDILDHIQQEGGIKPPGQDSGGEYDGYGEAMKGTAKLLRSSKGKAPDKMIEALQDYGYKRIQTPDDLWGAISKANTERDALRTNGGGLEAQTQRFWDVVGKNKAGVEKVTTGDLHEGQKFRVKGAGVSHEELEVIKVNPDGTVTVKDGTSFGEQDLPEGAEIYIAKGSLTEAPAGSTEFLPPEKTPISKDEFHIAGYDNTTKMVNDTVGNIYSLIRTIKRRSGQLAYEVKGYGRYAGKHPDLEQIYEARGESDAIDAAKQIAQREFVPPNNPPKLGAMEKGTGDLLKGQNEDFALTGEKGTDAERIAAAKAKAEQDAKDAAELEKKQQQKFIGMGGAVPEEFSREGSPTAMKFRKLDEERQKRGLEPLARPESVSDQATMDKAMAAIDLNPEIAKQLVEELLQKPRPIKDWESHVLLLQKIDLRNAYHRSAKAAADAYDDSQTYPDRRDDMLRHNLETDRISDELTRLEQASNLSGSERGRALRALQVMANEDFSLASLETQRRAAKGGAPLTDTERAELVKTAEDYKKANEELQKHLADRDRQLSEAASKEAFDRLDREAKQGPEYHPKILQAAERWVKAIDKKADAARERMKARGIRFNVGLDPTVLLDVAEIGASHLAHAIIDFAKWSLKMKAEFGEGIEPHLKEIYAASEKIIDGLKTEPAVKRHVEGKDFNAKVEDVKSTISEKVKKSETPEISGQVQKLARMFVQNGVKGREALIDAVHSVLQSILPEFTRRETMDAISGYGEFKQLSKDAISVKLRGMKGEMQQIAKLQDMADGIPPRKTGVERRAPTDEERALIKAVNEAKVKFQVPITDPATQLKSALDTRKTQLTNQIKDLERRITEGDYSKRQKSDLQLDRTAQELEAKKERVVKQFKTGQRKAELANRSGMEKMFDFVSNARRFAVLSGLNVLTKLAAYSGTRAIAMGATEAIGGVMSKLPYIRDVADRAPSEGATSVATLAKSVAKGLTQGFVDAYKTATTGSSDLKAAFSPRVDIDRAWYNFFQTVHEVVKSPLRRTAFELSLAKRMEFAARNGVDITDSLVQLRLSKEAYLDSDRALLLENNRVAGSIRAALKMWEARDKNTGRVPTMGKLAATAVRVEQPILTVPLNFAKQVLVSAFGSISGTAKLIGAFRRGLDTLTPQEADTVMRHLKYGTLGGAVMLYAFYDAYHNKEKSVFGGFYQKGEKRKEGQAPASGMNVAGTPIPSTPLHNPVIGAGQLGATMGELMAEVNKKTGESKHAIPTAVLAGFLGLLNESPLGRQSDLISSLSDPRDMDWQMGEHVKGILVPQIVNEAAQYLDKDSSGKPVKRNPTTITQHIETGIPGLRQTVPKK